MKRGACSLVFGVSGVGKTQACRNFAAHHPDYLVTSASSLLTEIKATTEDRLRTASAEEIGDNQHLLVTAFSKFRSKKISHPVLMDAHAVIDNNSNLIPVHVDIIRELQPDLLILLEASADEVATRRLLSSRKRPIRDISWIEQEIAAERAAVLHYSKTLGVDLRAAVVDEGFTLDAIL